MSDKKKRLIIRILGDVAALILSVLLYQAWWYTLFMGILFGIAVTLVWVNYQLAKVWDQ